MDCIWTLSWRFYVKYTPCPCGHTKPLWSMHLKTRACTRHGAKLAVCFVNSLITWGAVCLNETVKVKHFVVWVPHRYRNMHASVQVAYLCFCMSKYEWARQVYNKRLFKRSRKADGGGDSCTDLFAMTVQAPYRQSVLPRWAFLLFTQRLWF